MNDRRLSSSPVKPSKEFAVIARQIGRMAALVLLLAACGAPSTAPPAVSSATAPALLPTLATPTLAARRTVNFAASDGTQLTGTLYGAGATAVVLSNMGDNDPAPWDAFAPQLADRGYMVLTYKYRYPTNTSRF